LYLGGGENYLWHGDERSQQNEDHQINPEEPAQESKVGGHGGTKVRLNFLDP